MNAEPATSPLRRLQALGQSVWLDYIERRFVREGGLARMIEDDGVSGLTSNPALLQNALKEPAYADAIGRLAAQGLDAHEIYEALCIEDIRAAADALLTVHRRTQGRDGWVSLEISPLLARDGEGSYWEAKRLCTLVNRVNLLIKVPATAEALPAIRRLIADGICVNATLIFTPERYGEVVQAYRSGLRERLVQGHDLGTVALCGQLLREPDRHRRRHAARCARIAASRGAARSGSHRTGAAYPCAARCDAR
jgi:transaldolase